MLRRRIFSSAMASVMALSSIAVVANAEETAVANIKTEADLKAYIDSLESMRSDAIYEYGSISGQKFLDALEHADNVLDNPEAGYAEYTTAYAMVEATHAKLVKRSAEELKALVDSCTRTIERGNYYTEELGDPIYHEEAFDNFENAYYEAEALLDSTDTRVITDAYDVLDAAKNMGMYATVTKSQFRTAIRAYEAALQKQNDYDTWRRGTTSTSWKGTSADWTVQGTSVSYGYLYDVVASYEDTIYTAYDDLDEIKEVDTTSEADIVAGYELCVSATEVFNSFKADDTDRATKSSVTKLLDQYNGQLVHDYAKSQAEALAAAVVNAVGGKVTFEIRGEGDFSEEVKSADECYGEYWYVNVTKGKIVEAGIYAKSDTTYYIPVNEKGYWNGGDLVTSKTTGVDYKTITKKSTVDLTDYIDIMLYDIIERAEADYKAILEDEATNGVELRVAATTPGDDVIAAETEVEAALAAADTAVADALTNAAALEAANAATIAGYSAADQATMKKIMDAYVAKFNEADALLAYLNDEVVAVGAAEDIEEAAVIADKIAAADEHIDSYVKDMGWGTNNPINYINYWVEFQTYPMEGGDIRLYCNLSTDATAVYNSVLAARDALAAQLSALNNKIVYDDIAVEAPERARWDDVSNNATNDIWDDAAFTAEGAGWLLAPDMTGAMAAAKFYLETKKASDFKVEYNPLIDEANPISTTGALTIKNVSGSTSEWTVVNRYLKYALEDKYAAAIGTYTKKDVEALIEQAYTLADETGDAALFQVSHQALVDARAQALEWVKAANKLRTDYKDNYVACLYFGADKVATEVYEDLKGKYDTLANDLAAFKYSFGEIYKYIADVQGMVEDEEIEMTDALNVALQTAAYALSTVETLDNDLVEVSTLDNDAFTSDREFFAFNRVFTDTEDHTITINENGILEAVLIDFDGNSGVASHTALKNAYEALKAEVDKQLAPTVVKGDVNGDGTVNAKDAEALLKGIVGLDTTANMAVEVADMDNSGVVNAVDAEAILKSILGI